MNEEFKNEAIIKQLISKYEIKIKIRSIYYSINNEIIEKKTSINCKYFIKDD